MDSMSLEERDDDEQQLNQSSSSLASSAQVAEKRDDQNGLQENGTVVRAINPPPSFTNNIITPNYMGKHRLTAALTQLNHQIQIIQEELDELETLGQSSLVCRELVTAVESIPDALLPEIKGPTIVGWDRWFQGGSRTRKRWI